MDKTDGHPTTPLARCHRALPMLTIGLALLAGSTNLCAQQYIAERINEAYQAQLHTPQTKTRAMPPVAQVRSGSESSAESVDVKKALPKPKPQPES